MQKRPENDRIVIVGIDDENDTKKEMLTVEFIRDIDCLDEKELVSEIVGMTNTEGGVLYLEVEDNGEITVVHKKHKMKW